MKPLCTNETVVLMIVKDGLYFMILSGLSAPGPCCNVVYRLSVCVSLCVSVCVSVNMFAVCVSVCSDLQVRFPIGFG